MLTVTYIGTYIQGVPEMIIQTLEMLGQNKVKIKYKIFKNKVSFPDILHFFEIVYLRTILPIAIETLWDYS